MSHLRRRVAPLVQAVRRRRTDPAPQLFPPGAFYSPVVDAAEVTRAERGRVWPEDPADPPGLDLRPDAQLDLLEVLGQHRLPDPDTWDPPRYDPGNDQFPPQDAALLYAMVRHLRPQRIVEIGSGWSTTVTARAVRDGGLTTHLTCIDPHPRDFLSAIPQVAELRVEKVEHTPIEVFTRLGPRDVLFIDSSHVAKTGSDVVHEVLQILPRLRDGVAVHVHDVFIPEDYPIGWVKAGFGWNEQYLVHAYLLGNQRAHVLVGSRWLAVRHPEAVGSALGPVELAGSSLWFSVGAEPLFP
jgi:predicted O-methyltransferase YrrM